MTLAEIAQVQSVPENTAATRIHHAKRKLKDCVAAALGLKNSASRRDSST
jgi:DNA-directed RNA polymerase specialized sigma24 family protein